MKGLTKKQEAILDFIEKFQAKEQIPPTVYEIADHFGIQPATSFAHLRALQRKGYIDRTSKARSLTVLKPRNPHLGIGVFVVPILGKIKDTENLTADENISDTVKIDPALLPYGASGKNLFAIRMPNASAKGAGILEGDLIIARQKAAPSAGDIIVSMENTVPTAEKFLPHEGNTDYVLGVMVTLVRTT